VTAFVLPGDAPAAGAAVADLLAGWAGGDRERVAVAGVIAAVADAAGPVARRLARGEVPGDPKRIVGVNSAGDRQKALDLASHDYFVARLIEAGVAAILSEEAEEIIPCDPNGRVVVAIDPIDGSQSIGIGAPLGTLFGVWPAAGGLTQTGRAMLAAGYLSFGHTVELGFSVGDGVVIATLDPEDGVFRVVAERVAIAPEAKVVAYNASNQRLWAPGVQAYVADLLAGKEGPRGRDFNMRWLAAAVGDLHRILRQGGMFFYVADRNQTDGRLRLLYEAAPIAFLCEQAGGAATDGKEAILDRVPKGLHEFVPLVFGARDEVEVFGRYTAAGGKGD
jgi:fructose-1,6-bisphosphatase I